MQPNQYETKNYLPEWQFREQHITQHDRVVAASSITSADPQ